MAEGAGSGCSIRSQETRKKREACHTLLASTKALSAANRFLVSRANTHAKKGGEEWREPAWRCLDMIPEGDACVSWHFFVKTPGTRKALQEPWTSGHLHSGDQGRVEGDILGFHCQAAGGNTVRPDAHTSRRCSIQKRCVFKETIPCQPTRVVLGQRKQFLWGCANEDGMLKRHTRPFCQLPLVQRNVGMVLHCQEGM
jgi:hypothetical protein